MQMWLNAFKNGKTQLFNSGGVVKLAYFQKKWSIPLESMSVREDNCLYLYQSALQ